MRVFRGSGLSNNSMATATFQNPATVKLQSASPATSSGHDSRGETTSPSADPDTQLVPYQTLEHLMSARVSRSLRLQVIALWVLVVAGLFCLLQMFGYQRAMKDIGASQHRSITSLGNAMSAEQAQIGSVTNQLATLASHTKSRFREVDRHFSAEDRVTRQLAARINDLESTRAAPKTMRLGPVDLQSRQQPEHLSDVPSKAAKLESATAGRNRVTARIVADSPLKQHQHIIDMSIPPVPEATVHFDAMKAPDYWTVKRATPSGKKSLHVMPFEITPLGVKVHCIDDGFDYTVTTSGEWL